MALHSSFNWRCPFCNHHGVITSERYSSDTHLFAGGSAGRQALKTLVIVCPNDQCRRYALSAALYDLTFDKNDWKFAETPKQTWQLIPAAAMKPLPEYVPIAIRNDYTEACLIRTLSPKASATLARRCLQGMIRDFWPVKPGRLVDEIAALETKVDGETWEAIDAVRRIGNIGAHMEKDINVIADVEMEEAELLIGLIETLIDEWYVARFEREHRMAKIKAAAASKKPN